MKKLLLQVDTDPVVSTFDTIAAYDSDVDVVIPYGGITPATVKEIATGAIFSRGGEGWKHTGIFIGGHDVAQGEAVLAEVKKSFFGPFRVSLLLDSNGCNTTAAAAVAKIAKALPLAGQRVVVTGTGPVGTRVAALLAGEGARVTMTTVREDWLQTGLAQVRARTEADVQGAIVPNMDV
ncbi:MAG TPA: methylene-tetrahydromethanopterin dehydrogenase N-terminal domain-containing protein, partial [Symbiobacteriaceae bacterium]|nr:methylene-tetrahydromethanopterin dehydrogenase N-terminal domain-containing protein [Symbiobacteriaceae bacterium]